MIFKKKAKAADPAAGIRSRIEASLLSGALGDALGYEVEFSPLDQIKQRFGPGGIRALVPHEGKARFSDDTQMTLFTVEGMVLGYWRAEKKGIGVVTESAVYQAYLCWLITQGYPAKSVWQNVSRLLQQPELQFQRAPGQTCLAALRSGEMGMLAEGSVRWGEAFPINQSKGCGGVMRTAPLGYVRGLKSGAHPFGDPMLVGAACAAITHGHPMGYIPAGMLSDMVDRAIYGGYESLRQLVLDSLTRAEQCFPDEAELPAFRALISRAVELSGGSEPDESAVRALGEGWVGDEALAIAVYCALRHEKDLTACLIAAANHSGDSDSTAAIAGNLLGAWLGMEALNPAWTEQIECRALFTQFTDDLMRIITQN